MYFQWLFESFSMRARKASKRFEFWEKRTSFRIDLIKITLLMILRKLARNVLINKNRNLENLKHDHRAIDIKKHQVPVQNLGYYLW